MIRNMFISHIRFYICLSIILFMLTGTDLEAQIQSAGYLRAVENFESGNYSMALKEFDALAAEMPGNYHIRYYRACCQVEMNRDLPEAVEVLHGMARNGEPAEANLYLGMAYQRLYNFSEAIRYYERYDQAVSKQEAKARKVSQKIMSCRSAREITANYNQYDVIAVTFLDMTDSAQYMQIKMPGGRLQRKPMVFFGPGEDPNGLNSLMFIPDDALRGDYIYFSGTAGSEKNGLQLFRVRKRAGKSWGDPEEVKALNTEGDELLPYFDPNQGDLYFASDGGAGIGGFDLYKSHYDSDRDNWSIPINLGFPVNSAMDEFLLLPGTDLGLMMFFSNRQGTDSTLTVYRVQLVEPKKRTDPENTRMLLDIASLGNAAGEILAELEEVQKPSVPGQADTGQLAAQRDERPDPGITEVRILTPDKPEVVTRPARQEILADALMHQAASDSLKDLSTAARANIRQSDDPNDRWVWQKQIMVWENRASKEEELADALYAMVYDEEVPVENHPAVYAPEIVNPAGEVEGEPGTPPRPVAASAIEEDSEINRFDILRASPYSERNPIPMDVSKPSGVFYRIQIGAFQQPVEPDAFAGISPITADTEPGQGLIKYYAGKFSRYSDASDALARIRSSGYEDAFIVSWYNGEAITTQRAKQLE
jgi:tetratricopeptide (TPR) repeat protein